MIDGFDSFDALESHEQSRSGVSTGLLTIPKDVDIWWPKPEETGPSRIVILPYKTTASPYTQPGKPHYFRDYYVYRNLGADGKGRYFDCKRTFNEACPIGDALTTKGRSQRLALVNALQLLDDDTVKHAVMDFSHFNFLSKLLDDIAAKIKKNEKKYGYLRKFVVAGTVIDFAWEIDTFEGAKFCSAAAFDYEPWDGDIEEWYPKAVDLDTVFNKMSYAAAQYKFFGIGEPGTQAPSDQEVPVTKTEKAKDSPKQEAVTDSKFKKNDTVYFEGKKYSVVKITENGVKILDDDGDVQLVQEDQLSLDPPVTKTTKSPKTETAKPKETVAASAAQDDWDANWDVQG